MIWQFLITKRWPSSMSTYGLKQLKTFATVFRLENEKLYRLLSDKQLWIVMGNDCQVLLERFMPLWDIVGPKNCYIAYLKLTSGITLVQTVLTGYVGALPANVLADLLIMLTFCHSLHIVHSV